MKKPQNKGLCGSEEYWNADITWSEVQNIVKTMANGKGLGIDGIGGEVYKAIVRCKWPRDGKGLACILLRVLNAILNGNIREDLMTWTVVSVPKTGDLTDKNNSRGLYEFDACVGEVGVLIEIIQCWTTKTQEKEDNQRSLVGDELKAFAWFIDGF